MGSNARCKLCTSVLHSKQLSDAMVMTERSRVVAPKQASADRLAMCNLSWHVGSQAPLQGAGVGGQVICGGGRPAAVSAAGFKVGPCLEGRQ